MHVVTHFEKINVYLQLSEQIKNCLTNKCTCILFLAQFLSFVLVLMVFTRHQHFRLTVVCRKVLHLLKTPYTWQQWVTWSPRKPNIILALHNCARKVKADEQQRKDDQCEISGIVFGELVRKQALHQSFNLVILHTYTCLGWNSL